MNSGKIMVKFTDKRKRDWIINVDAANIQNVREALGVDLGNRNSFKRLARDPSLLCNVLFVLCEEQAKERGVSDVQFGRLLATGNVIAHATKALIEAVRGTM